MQESEARTACVCPALRSMMGSAGGLGGGSWRGMDREEGGGESRAAMRKSGDCCFCKKRRIEARKHRLDNFEAQKKAGTRWTAV